MRNLALKLINQWRIRVEQSQDLSPDEQEQLMNFSPAYIAWEEQTLQKGRQEGRQEGERMGELRGQREMLLRQLTLKFGSLSAQVVSQVQAIDNTWKRLVLRSTSHWRRLPKLVIAPNAGSRRAISSSVSMSDEPPCECLEENA
jgi:flagellar biosynthesis/type III secretory pathway protein FliH